MKQKKSSKNTCKLDSNKHRGFDTQEKPVQNSLSKLAKKKFGQHFLKNRHVIYKIINALPQGAPQVIEIGPGYGALTQLLLEKHCVRAIEIDQDCVQVLNEKFAKEIAQQKLEIINQNVLESALPYMPIVGNLPYNIGTKIIEKLVYAPTSCAVFMLQKEVAERITGVSYSKLGIFVQARYDVVKVIDVSRTDFSPKPKVESQVIKLIEHHRLAHVDLRKLSEYTKIMFANRRKKLASLKKSHPEFAQFLLANNIDLNLRAEDLKKEIYYQLATTGIA